VSKVVILGIDALDAALLKRWRNDLPHFSRIMDEGYFAPLESTMPPDSIPAWVTIYTGMQPWEHGVVDSMDYLDIRKGAQAVDTGTFKGKTFWDKAGEAGKRVCVVNPLLAYPVWPVNGIMVKTARCSLPARPKPSLKRSSGAPSFRSSVAWWIFRTVRTWARSLSEPRR